MLPAVVTLALLKWMFGTTTKLTNLLLVPIPKDWKFVNGQSGEIWWFWSLAALAIAGFGVALIGQLGRYYVGKQIIASFDSLMLQVPLLNKIYGTIKQVNENVTLLWEVCSAGMVRRCRYDWQANFHYEAAVRLYRSRLTGKQG